MATTITMPKLGLTMNSGSVQQWKKKIGDPVKKGELLYVVATDKLTVDVEAPADGVLLAITIKEGQDVPVGAPIGIIGAAGEKIEPAVAPVAPIAAASATAPAAAFAPVATGGRTKSGVVASPKAKKLARGKGVDLTTLKGTGPNGWIVARDVSAAPASAPVKASPVAAKMAAEGGIDLVPLDKGGRIMKADIAAALMEAAPAGSGGRRVPVTQMRRIIGERMLLSVDTIPAVSYFADVDMGTLNDLRTAYNERLAKQNIKISVNDILMKLCAKLLLEYPMVNASVETDASGRTSAFILHDSVNIGFAVALKGGLLVPNIKDVQLKSLTQIARERAVLVEKARVGGLEPDQVTGGTFTISNLGMMGIDSFTPIVNPPEAAILGVGTTADRAAVRGGSLVARPVATFCLTADHRLVDGADAAEFLAKLKELTENPVLFLL